MLPFQGFFLLVMVLSLVLQCFMLYICGSSEQVIVNAAGHNDNSAKL